MRKNIFSIVDEINFKTAELAEIIAENRRENFKGTGGTYFD
ncbi:MAG: hypothetical protein N3F03_07770 [Ignavibacteria bacterium]|nr:hypothetical protein [Ignavibacteria bacterium]